MSSGALRNTGRFNGKYYSVVGNASDQVVKSTPGLIGFVAASGTGNVIIKDGSGGTQICLAAAPFAFFLGVETQVGIAVNGPATATAISVMYS